MDDNTQGREFGELSKRDTPTDATEDTQDEQVEETTEDSQEETTEQPDNQESTEENQDESEEGTQEPKLTEKGTKLDPNPQSAVHQELANERKARGQMEQLLSDPNLMAKFVKQQYGMELTPQQAQQQVEAVKEKTATTKRWAAKDFENIDDVANVVNQLQEGLESKISEKDQKIEALNQQVTGLSQTRQMERIADTMQADVSSLRSEPELDSKSPDFIPGLEEEIGSEYNRLDFDKKTGKYRGEHTLKGIGTQLLRVARSARKVGSKKAQTIVKDKTGGGIKTSAPVKSEGDTSNLSAGDSIDQGIAKKFPQG